MRKNKQTKTKMEENEHKPHLYDQHCAAAVIIKTAQKHKDGGAKTETFADIDMKPAMDIMTLITLSAVLATMSLLKV